MKKYSLVIITFTLCSALVTPFLISKGAGAISASDWQAGRIIDDGLFNDANSMTVTDIQNFLNSLVPNCDTNGTQPASDWGRSDLTHAQFAALKGWPPPPYVCLKEYYEVPKTSPGAGVPDNSYNHYDASSGTLLSVPGGVSAAQLIYSAAQQYQISPKVLLIKIRSESAGPLTNDSWPLPSQYTYAMGAHCPDTGPNNSANCDPNYAGFSIQISEAASLLRYYLDNMGQPWWPYKKVGVNNILYNPDTSCGSSNVNITTSATAALYTYTPYQPNAGALAAGYGTAPCGSYGNRNFWLYYNDWFGSTWLPSVIKGPSDPSIYVQEDGYKFYVPTIAILQDFGLGTGAQTVAQSTIDSIPTGNSTVGLSSSLGIVAKSSSDTDSDGGSIYLITSGHRYLFTTTQQMADFGYGSADISYFPLDFLQSIPSGGVLSNYVRSNVDSSIFQVSGDVKKLILDKATLQSLDPDSSLSVVSNTVLNPIPSGDPDSNTPALISTSAGNMYLYSSGAYAYIPSPDVLNCWGFMTTLSMSVYKIQNDNYTPTISPSPTPLGCSVNINAISYVLNGGNRISVPTADGFDPATSLSSDLTTLASQLPVRNQPLAQVVSATNSSGVWYIENGLRKVIPSVTDLHLLNISGSVVDKILPGALNSLAAGKLKVAVGQVVRANDTGTIYVITSPTTMSWVSTMNDFVAYGYSTATMDSVTSSQITQSYTVNQNPLGKYMYTPVGGIYIMDPSGCYGFTQSQASNFGVPLTASAAGQTYSSNIFPYINLVNCKPVSQFVKSTSQGTVYQIINGIKHPISSWAKLQSLSHETNPTIMVLSDALVSTYPSGSVL